jgi:nucleotide-binding universal stress UspA family protein
MMDDCENQMYKTILVPLDGSKRAERILPHVEELAFRFEAKVIFIRVIELNMNTIDPRGSDPVAHSEMVDDLVEEAEVYLSALKGEFREKGIRVKTILDFGGVVGMISNTAEREGVDLIAMASHGRTGLRRVFYGSMAAGVLQQVDRPLLLIRARRNS